jgi:hypothetical protein
MLGPWTVVPRPSICLWSPTLPIAAPALADGRLPNVLLALLLGLFLLVVVQGDAWRRTTPLRGALLERGGGWLRPAAVGAVSWGNWMGRWARRRAFHSSLIATDIA